MSERPSDDGPNGAKAVSRSNEGSEPPASGRGDDLTTCPLCGARMYGVHCKQICPNCGFKEDCSDLFPL